MSNKLLFSVYMFARSCTQKENNSFKFFLFVGSSVQTCLQAYECVYFYEASQNYSNYKYNHILNVSYSFNETSNNETSMKP